MKKTIYVIIFMIMIFFIFSINTACYAVSLGGIEQAASDFLKKGSEEVDKYKVDDGNGGEISLVSKTIKDNIVPIVKILLLIGTIIIGIAMVILGIQWVCSKPAPEAQAKLKTKFVSLAVTAGILFGSYTIWSVVVKIFDIIDG